MEAVGSKQESQPAAQNAAAYVFHEVISHVPLSAEGEDNDLYITCVDFWGTSDDSLCIRTSRLRIEQMAIST